MEISMATVRDCTFSSNSAQSGGAIYTRYSSQARFIGCDIGYTTSNTAYSSGDEIYTDTDYVPTYSFCGIRGASYSNGTVHGPYCGYSTEQPIDGGNNY